MHVFEDFHYEREIGAEGSSDHALLFRARVGTASYTAATSFTRVRTG